MCCIFSGSYYFILEATSSVHSAHTNPCYDWLGYCCFWWCKRLCFKVVFIIQLSAYTQVCKKVRVVDNVKTSRVALCNTKAVAPASDNVCVSKVVLEVFFEIENINKVQGKQRIRSILNRSHMTFWDFEMRINSKLPNKPKYSSRCSKACVCFWNLLLIFFVWGSYC